MSTEQVMDDNVLELSDDEFEQLAFPDLDQPEPEPTDTVADAEPEVDEPLEPAEPVLADEDPVLDEGEQGEPAAMEPDATDVPETTEPTDTSAAEDSADEIDYRAEYQKILAPFKANGREMQVDSVDDALTLMKQGANYNKKMAALAPNLRVLKTLEKHNLLDENKLNHLIDLDKKNPAAIAQLLKDSEIDPLDLDSDTSDYTPESHVVDETVVELDSVIADIQDTPTGDTTLNIVANQWDDASRDVLLKNPSVISLINTQVASGTFEQISQVIEKERMMGRLNGLSDIEAYKQVGDRLHAEGKLGGNQPPAQESPANAGTPARKAPDPKLNSRKRAASTPKAAPAKTNSNPYNPLAMSDEEFLKSTSSRYM